MISESTPADIFLRMLTSQLVDFFLPDALKLVFHMNWSPSKTPDAFHVDPETLLEMLQAEPKLPAADWAKKSWCSLLEDSCIEVGYLRNPSPRICVC